MPKKKSKKALKAQRARARRRRTIKTTVETAALLVVLLVCVALWRATSGPGRIAYHHKETSCPVFPVFCPVSPSC